MISVYEYLDYRDFLKTLFDYEKSKNDFYSYRYISNKTGIDAGYYLRIIKKQKHIGEGKLDKLVQFLDFKDENKEKYFRTLVRYNKTKNSTFKKELFNELLKLKNSVELQISHYNYFSQWYTIPVRELLHSYNFDGNYQNMAQKFIPPLDESEVQKAINTLKSLGMVVQDSEGYLRPKDNHLTPGDQWGTIAVRNFQKKMIGLAKEAIERFPKEKRSITSMTISTSWKNIEIINQKLSHMRQEILELIDSDEETDGVFQLNLQLFPLTDDEIK